MSRQNRSRPVRQRQVQAPVFAALGDITRLQLVAALGKVEDMSIQQLAAGSELTRQAITKHLRVLERAGLVRCQQAGRERRFSLHVQPLQDASRFLAQASLRWDAALLRLQALVEER